MKLSDLLEIFDSDKLICIHSIFSDIDEYMGDVRNHRHLKCFLDWEVTRMSYMKDVRIVGKYISPEKMYSDEKMYIENEGDGLVVFLASGSESKQENLLKMEVLNIDEYVEHHNQTK